MLRQSRALAPALAGRKEVPMTDVQVKDRGDSRAEHCPEAKKHSEDRRVRPV